NQSLWIPAFAGMTTETELFRTSLTGEPRAATAATRPRRPDRTASVAQPQRGMFVERAVFQDHHVAAVVLVEQHRDRRLEQRPAHEGQAPLEDFERIERDQLRGREPGAQRARIGRSRLAAFAFGRARGGRSPGWRPGPG